MITIKSKREIALMREAGRIVALAHQAVREHIKPGISTLDLDRIAHDVIIQHDAIPSFKGYGGFSGSICASMNEVVVHGIPNPKDILSEGDIISIDIGAYYKGYHGDAAKTYPVGTISDEDQQLLNVTEQSLFAGLAYAKPGNHLSDVSHAIYQYATAYGYGVVDQFTGHGIGQKLHEAPEIPNFGDPGCGPILRAGMTLAIEPMINQGSKDVKVLLDHWTTITVDRKKSAHFEHTIVITDDGYDILTTL